MKIKFTIKIKDDKNPPIFKEELGKGVLQTIVVDFKDLSEEDLKNDALTNTYIFEMMNKFKEEWVEVKYEING
jgi:hypothetical protein